MLADLRTAFAFLTILPIGSPPGRKPGYSFAWFPLVGFVIGLCLAGIALITPPQLRAYLIVAAWVILTGGLHLDGFGDSCDGVLAAVMPERRLEIMKDPRAGTWAVVGLILLLAGKLSFTTQVHPLLLIAAPVTGRWVMVTSAYCFPYARTQGLGGYFRDGLGMLQWSIASIMAAAILAALAFSKPIALIPLLLAPLLTWCIGSWAAQRLGGGLTGDTYGALCELTELICLAVWVWVS